MPRTIPHRELRNNSAAILREVRDGETIDISNHGEIVAVLVPPAQRSGASIRVREARRQGGFTALTRTRIDRPAQESIDDLRGDR